MNRDHEELSIEPRDDGNYVLIRVNGEGIRTEIILSEANVVFLGRLAPMIARRIVASKSPAGSGVSASVAAPVKDFHLNSDLHNEVILLRIRDEFDGEFDFSFSPADGRSLGQRLIAWFERIAAAPKPSKQ
jgi:hypothetical protein